MQCGGLLEANDMAWLAQEHERHAVLEHLYWSQQEQEYHTQLQEYYVLRQQHQLNQQRLNQVLYGQALAAQQAQQQHCQQQAMPASMPHVHLQHQQQQEAQAHCQHQADCAMAHASGGDDALMMVASPVREPLQPLPPTLNCHPGGPGPGWGVAAQQKAAMLVDASARAQLTGRKRSSDAAEYGAGKRLR